MLEQNPFFCYGISDMNVRKTCIGDASNPAMKKKLTGMSQEERDLLLSNNTLPIPAPIIPPAQAVTGPPAASPSGNATGNAQNSSFSAEQIIYNTAVESNEVTLCEQISDTDLLKSCIAQVAKQHKSPSDCDLLSTYPDIELCRMYSQGGEKG